MLWTALGAAHVAMARMTTRIPRDRSQPVGILFFPDIVDQGPRAVERRGTEVFRIPFDDVAGGVAHAAADALDAFVDRNSFFGLRRHLGEIVLPGLSPAELAFRARPLVEELAHVGHQVADHGKISQRADLQVPAHLVDMRPAGPARYPVHRHRARAAHADPAGVAVREGGIEMTLDVGDDIEHGLARMARNVERLERTRGAAAPDRNFKSGGQGAQDTRW